MVKHWTSVNLLSHNDNSRKTTRFHQFRALQFNQRHRMETKQTKNQKHLIKKNYRISLKNSGVYIIFTYEYSHPSPSLAQGGVPPSPPNNASSLSTDHSGVPVKALSPEAVHLINWAAPWKILMLRWLFLFHLACSWEQMKKVLSPGL